MDPPADREWLVGRRVQWKVLSSSGSGTEEAGVLGFVAGGLQREADGGGAEFIVGQRGGLFDGLLHGAVQCEEHRLAGLLRTKGEH